MNKVQLPTWSVPLALFFACLLSFGLLIPWLGFYWDDWPAMWFLHFLGPSGFVDVFASDRPLLGRLFWLTTSVLGESTIGWQLFGFLTRWASSLALWWILRVLWPSRPQTAAWIALLFALYPGFGQQFIAVTYSHVFVILTVLFLSMVSMILALRKRSWFWSLYIASVVGAAYSMFSVEYFFGLELLRPILLWIELSRTIQKRGKRLKKVFLYWAPYLALMIVFLVWRIFLHQTPRGEVGLFGNIQSDPLGELLNLGRTILGDMFEASLVAWLQTLNFLNLKNFGLAPTLLYVFIVLAAAAVFIFYLLKYKATAERSLPGDAQSNEAASYVKENPSRRWGGLMVLAGLFSLFIAGWPFWATGLPIGLDFPWDRFTLTMMVGASLLVVGLLLLLTKSNLYRAIIVGLLAGLAVGLHFQTANQFRREWNSQKAFFWQLTWRAPGLEPGTMILTSELPFEHYSDNSLTAPLNWTYSPHELPAQMPYMFYQIESRVGDGLENFEKGFPIEQDYRATRFTGSTDQTLVLYYAPPACVQVLDKATRGKIPQKPKYISDAMPLSNLDLILPFAEPPAQPPLHILGPEPEHGWCYHYEKADLARQLADWDLVVELGERVFQLGERLYPVNAPEYLPYIEGYAMAGDWRRAQQLTIEAFDLNSRMDRVLCSTWERIANTTSPDIEGETVLSDIRTALGCTAP